MATIPNFSFVRKNWFRKTKRSPQLRDCTPGEIVCLPGMEGFWIVSRMVNAADCVVHVTSSNVSLKRMCHDDPVIRITGQACLEPVLSSMQAYLPNLRPKVGNLLVTQNRAVLIGDHKGTDHASEIQLCLESFVISGVTQLSPGVQFSQWSLKLLVNGKNKVELVQRNHVAEIQAPETADFS